MKILRAIFYRFYTLMEDCRTGSPAFSANLLITMLTSVTVMTVYAAYNVLIRRIGSPITRSGLIIYFLSIAVANILMHFAFGRDSKLAQIQEVYSNEPVKSRTRGKLFVIGCMVFTILLFLCTCLIMARKNAGNL